MEKQLVAVGIFSTLRELRKQKDSDSYRSLVEWVIQVSRYKCRRHV